MKSLRKSGVTGAVLVVVFVFIWFVLGGNPGSGLSPKLHEVADQGLPTPPPATSSDASGGSTSDAQYFNNANFTICSQLTVSLHTADQAFRAALAQGEANTSSNPITLVNQLLHQYMDEYDGLVAMQNQVARDMSVGVPADLTQQMAPVLASMNYSMTAQDQYVSVLENLLQVYLASGSQAATQVISSPGQSLPQLISQEEAQQAAAERSAADLADLPQLEAQLRKLAGQTDSSLANMGLNQCEVFGVAGQDYLVLANSIPNVAADYIQTYNAQSATNQPISLAQVLSQLPEPQSLNNIY